MTIKINGTNTTAQPSITGADTDTGLVYGTDQVQIVTGGATRATVDSSGNLGLGTASPSGLIHTVQASGASRIRFEASNSHSFTRLIAGSTSYNSSVELFSGSTNTANITGLGAGGLQFEVGGSERLRILSSGGLTFNGDTAAANALDDYEEGTFTAVPDTANLTLNSNYTTWSYRKIGSLVHIKGLLLVSSVSGSNAIEIGGIPFNNGAHPSNGSSSAAGAVMYNGPTVGDRGLAVYIPGGADHIRFYKVNNNAGWSQLSNADLAANDEIHLSITYYV